MFSFIVSLSGTECVNEFIASFRRMPNESWVDQIGNIMLDNSLWSPRQPNGGDFQKCSTYKTHSGKYHDVSCLFKSCFVCSWKYQPAFTLRGLCAKSQIDNQYVLRPELDHDKNIFFYGVGRNNIIFDKSKHSWVIVEDNSIIIGPENTSDRPKKILGTLWLDKSDSHHTPVGTQFWNLTDGCNNLLPLTLTSVSYRINRFNSFIIHDYSKKCKSKYLLDAKLHKRSRFRLFCKKINFNVCFKFSHMMTKLAKLNHVVLSVHAQ